MPNLRIWDSQTGLTRLYCVPQVGLASVGGFYPLSPDNRYLTLNIILPEDGEYSNPPLRTLILDTETGYVTEVSREVLGIDLWTIEG